MKRTLPKKWYIKLTEENQKEIGKWRKNGATGSPFNGIPYGYAYSEPDKGFWTSTLKKGFTEITTAEFRKFVLKTPTTKKSIAKFTLPERWCVERNSLSSKTINNWINAHLLPLENNYSADSGWIYSERVSKGTNFRSDTDGFSVLTHNKFTLITFEQFKEFVLKETPVKVKTTKRTGPSKVAPVVKLTLPEKYIVRVLSRIELNEVATQLKEQVWEGQKDYDYVVWDKDNKGSALWNEIPSRGIDWPIFTYAEWKELYYPSPTVAPIATKKVTIEEIVACTTKTWIKCTSVEQGRKVGEYRNKDGALVWQDFDFSQYKEFYCYPHYNGNSIGGWNSTPCDSNPVIDFNDVIFPTKATLPTEDFGIIAEAYPQLVLDWFKNNGYDTSEWNGNADGNYIYFVQKDKEVDCDSLKNYEANIKGTIFTLTQIKEMTQKTQKIVGYKAPTDLWGGDVKKGEIFILAGQANYCPKDNQIEELYIPKELVETWEPVYEEVITSKVANLGTPKRKFTIYKDKVEVLGGDNETRTFTKEHIDTLGKMFTSGSIRNLNTRVSSIQVGCSDGTCLTATDFDTIKRTQSSL